MHFLGHNVSTLTRTPCVQQPTPGIVTSSTRSYVLKIWRSRRRKHHAVIDGILTCAAQNIFVPGSKSKITHSVAGGDQSFEDEANVDRSGVIVSSLHVRNLFTHTQHPHTLTHSCKYVVCNTSTMPQSWLLPPFRCPLHPDLPLRPAKSSLRVRQPLALQLHQQHLDWRLPNAPPVQSSFQHQAWTTTIRTSPFPRQNMRTWASTP